MIEIRRILCPIDFSGASRHALEHALAIARWYESEVTALHVIQPPVMPTPPILFVAGGDPEWVEEPERQARAEDELRIWLEAAGPRVKTAVVVARGRVAASILDTAKSMDADLIVMGTHGLGGFERFVLGSATEKVLRKAACPVLTVPPASQTSARLPYARLLCPVDFSDSSLAALRFAFSMAEEADANLTILHAFDWPPDEELLTERFDAPAFRRMVEENVRSRLEALVPEDVKVWCKPSTTVAYGKPYREILRIAESERADLIVIGVHGRNPVDLALFGSTTNHVVRRASCPVLTLKS
jgi:nucleotide-binding universal stress UspA family protein